MKFAYPFLLFISLLNINPAFAAYDSSWYVTEFWSGEYPNGFSVIEENVSVPARSAMDPNLQPTIQCQLPFRAVFHTWNEQRPAQYFTASKIVLMTAAKDFELEDDNSNPVPVKKGEKVEYLIYGAEGSFLVRFKGVEYNADQSLFDDGKIAEASENLPFHQEEWIHLTCKQGVEAWIFFTDLLKEENGDRVYLPGLDSWSRGFREYGSVTDLSDEDLKK